MEKRKSVFSISLFYKESADICFNYFLLNLYVGRIIDHILIDGSPSLMNNFHLP